MIEQGKTVLELSFFSLESTENFLDISLYLNAFCCFNSPFVGFIRVWSTHFEKIRVQEGSPVLIFRRPKGLPRVTQYSILGKKCQNTLIARVLEKGL